MTSAEHPKTNVLDEPSIGLHPRDNDRRTNFRSSNRENASLIPVLVLATQTVPGGTQTVQWEHHDPSDGSFRTTDASGQFSGQSAEMDAVGANAGLVKPFTWNVPDKKGLPVPYPEIADMLTHPGGACDLDRMPIPCEIRNSLMEAGALESEFLAVQINGKDGRHPVREPLIPVGLGLLLVRLPDGARDNDQGWNLYLFSLTPQNPATQIMAPIGGLDKMKAQLEQALKYSDCREAMQKLLAQIGVEAKFAPSHTDILDLFNALRNQTGGGGIFVDVPSERLNDFLPEQARGEAVPGGGGVSNFYYTDRGNWRTRQRWSVVFVKSVFSDRPAFERLPYDYVVTLIHEITHNAPNDSSGYGLTYTHKQMDRAAKTLGTSAGFDQYVREHCIPQKYWIPQK